MDIRLIIGFFFISSRKGFMGKIMKIRFVGYLLVLVIFYFIFNIVTDNVELVVLFKDRYF